MTEETKAPPNPPAFARPCGMRATAYNDSQTGMSLRDYFAGEALPSVFAMNRQWLDSGVLLPMGVTVAQVIARDCYEMADAMLAERAKGAR